MRRRIVLAKRCKLQGFISTSGSGVSKRKNGGRKEAKKEETKKHLNILHLWKMEDIVMGTPSMHTVCS